MAATAPSTVISGLPRRLVQDGIVDEETMLEALEKTKKSGETVVAQLVDENLADAQAIAVAASHEFGVPVFDLDALEQEWRALYPLAWSDFHRFMKGWSPGHWKVHSYSERIAREVVTQLSSS